MKRYKFFIFSILVVLLFVVVSCSDKVDNYTQPKQLDNLSRKDELILYSLSQDYKIPEATLLSDLEDFVIQKEKTTATKGLSSSNINKIELQQKSTYKVPLNNVLLTHNSKKSSNAKEADEINLYLFETESTNGNGYAIVSDDMRIGEILCVVDGEFNSDITNNEFMQFYSNALKNHIDTTVELWNSISEKDIEEAKLKYGITDEDIKNAQSSNATKRFWGWEYGPWYVKETLYPTKTQWGEEAPYNIVAEKLSGYRYLMGTPTVALSQIMAYYNYPETCKDEELKQKVVEKFPTLKDWDGIYDWKGMTKNKDMLDCDEKSQLMIGTLMYQNKQKLYDNLLYSDDKITIEKIWNILNEYGFHLDPIKDYNFDDVENSIGEKNLVLVSGYDTNEQKITKTKHGWWIFSYTDTTIENNYSGQAFWLIDAIRQKKRQNTYFIFWIPFRHTQTMNFVHCNFGRSGEGNGWYYSGVFNMEDVMTDEEVRTKGATTETTTSTSDKDNYAFRIKMICEISPNKGDN